MASAAFATAPLIGGCESDDDDTTPPAGDAKVFLHGVASGDPLPDRAVFWTRVTPSGSAATAHVELEIAADPAFEEIVKTASASTDVSRDYTVKLDVGGLSAGTTYYYRFHALGQSSPTGRTRTAPTGPTERLRIGVVSCSSFAHGLFNAYRRLAERTDIDVVLHLGDYIYEYGNGSYGNLRAYDPPTEIVTLDDYRRRHAQYKLDADLQELHRQHPFITVWDDHESANDAWRDGAENHTPETEGPWNLRKAAAVQAYAEWLPIRLPDPARPDRIYRRFTYGDLVDLIMLDTRLAGRDQQVRAVNAASVNDEGRELLGADQRSFLNTALAESRARWTLLGQQVMFGQLRIPGLPELSQLTGLPLPRLQELLSSLPLVGTGGLILNPDQWDGYRAERRRVLDLIDALKPDNVVVLTGDIHTSWAMDLSPDPNNPLVYNPLDGRGSRAVEFVTPSVTSPGLEPLAALDGVVRLLNPHIKYVDLAQKGYLLLDITPERVQGEWWYVDTISMRSDRESFGAAYITGDGENRLRAAAGPALAASGAPAAAP